MRRVVIRLLGSFEVTVDDAPVSSFEYAKVRALLAYLAIEARYPQPRAVLATLLWPDQPERVARASLSQALTTLRNALGDKTADSPLLIADVQQIQLDPHSVVEVDALQFLASLTDAETHTHRSWRTCAACSERLRHAMNLYRGAFLADVAIPDSTVFEEWATLWRERLTQRAMSSLERLIERASWCDAYHEALTYAERLVALDPLLEGGQRSLMRLLALNGEITAAKAHYRQLQALLAEELGLPPEEATTALYEQIRREDLAGLQQPHPPVVVPSPPTSLVGRSNELQAICEFVREQDGRALTITGTGGIGKTRIAIEAAHSLRFDFEDGIYVVELAALSNAALVADAVARVLGVKERSQQPIRVSLREALRARHLLLILDNFEHVVEAAPLVSELLAACPALSVLVTSRVPLQIRAEQLFVLEPLHETEAVELFFRRAQAVGASLAGDEASIGVYTAICRRLDQLPLAIELIAVRARTLAPRELLHQLEQPFEALAHGPRDMSPRHRSLRHAIQWSYDLLAPEEQRVFRALGVFAGGCTAEAAQAALGSTLAVLPVLETLTQASLLKRRVVADKTHFLLLETIREFALEQLILHGEVESAQERHAGYYADFAMTVYDELLRPEAPRWRAWVAAEYDNLRAAFGWAMVHQVYEMALRLATGIWRFHLMAGYLREGLERLEAALAYRQHAPLKIQCDALRAAGTLATTINDYPRARQWLQEAVEIAWRLGDQSALQTALQKLGTALLEQGELEDARIHLEVALSLAQRGEDPTLARFSLVYLSDLHRRLGDYAQAQALGEECLRINQARQDPGGTGSAIVILGGIALAQGDTRRAHELAEQALTLHRALDHQLGIGTDFALLGDIASAQGRYHEALDEYQRCLRTWQERESSVISAIVLDSVAQSLSRLGEPARGATLLSAAAAIRERAGARLTSAEQAICDETEFACRQAMDAADLARAWGAGRHLTLAQAIELALQPLR